MVTKGLITVFDIIDEIHEPIWYKELEREGIADAVQRTEWRQSIAETGGQLVSELILRHALPNANHRTSIGFLELYLRTFGELPRIPETGSPEGWSEWANEYIMESKRLLTTRRKSNLFKYIESLGATGVMRKHGVKIDFARYDPDVSNPLREYGRRHRSASVSFVREYLNRAGVSERGSKSDKGLRVCAARLE